MIEMVITITGEWLNTLSLPYTRPYMLSRILELAQERHAIVRIAGQHWDKPARI